MRIINERQAASGFHREQGFSLVQMLITLAVIVIVSAFGFLAIDTARASMRLSGATRELAGYLEKARSNAIRRNGTANVSFVDANSYSVTMDSDGDGTPETRTISLPDGVSFADGSAFSITFDWRGKIPNQVGIGLKNTHEATDSINISGSGDITLRDEIFQDGAIGEVNLNSNPSDVVASPTPTPLPSPGATPIPSPSPSPSPDPSASPTPSPSPSPVPSPSPSPSTSPSPSPSASPSPTPTASPSPSPSPGGCSISAPATLTLPKNASPKTISVTVTNAASTTLTATSSGSITGVSPATTTVSGNGTIPYSVTYPNGSITSGTVTITSPCGNQTINITFN